MNADEAKQIVNALTPMVSTIENKLAELAVEHRIGVYLNGPYGANRWVVLAEDENGYTTPEPVPGYTHNYIEEGQWMASAGSC